MIKAFYNATVKSYFVSKKLKGINPALLYHVVGTGPYRSNQHASLHYVELKRFIKQVTALARVYQFVFADEFFRMLRDGESLNGYACLTFDDGYASTLASISDFLETQKIPATFFVTSSLAGGNILWRDKIRYMLANNLIDEFTKKYYPGLNLPAHEFYGKSKDPSFFNSKALDENLTIFMKQKEIHLPAGELYCSWKEIEMINDHGYLMAGNHTHHHYMLSTLPGEEQRMEIDLCQQELKQYLKPGKISKIFSMPFGGYHTFNRDTISCLKELGFSGSFISEPGHYLKGKSLRDNIDGFDLYKRYLPKHYLRVLL